MEDPNEVREQDSPEEVKVDSENPLGSTQHGVTSGEQRDGEPLGVRLGREVPEGLGNRPDDVGRIMDPESEDQRDDTPEAVGELADEEPSDLSAEEAAVHVEPEKLSGES